MTKLYIWFYVDKDEKTHQRARYLVTTKGRDRLPAGHSWDASSTFRGTLTSLLRIRPAEHITCDETVPEEVTKWLTLAAMGLPINPPDTLDQLLQTEPTG